MSMLSAQCDELRERAKVLRQGRWSDGADDARLMEDAADTIWQLRDDLQRANTENAKLRELLLGAFDDMNAWQRVIAGSNEWGYGKGCLDSLCKLRDAMQELGMEVVV